MAGRPKKIDDSKVFDVSRPNRAKPVGTSRPVITNAGDPVVDSMINQDMDMTPAALSVPTAPSVSKKTIKPLEDEATKQSETTTEMKDEVEQEVSEAMASAPVLPIEINEDKAEEPIEPTVEEEEPAEPAPNAVEETKVEKVEVKEKSEPKKEELPKEDGGEEVEESKDNKETAPEEPENEETATIDAVVDQTANKSDNKEAQLNPAIDMAVRDLIESKKYFVPLSHDSGKKHHGAGLWLLLGLIVVLVGFYLSIDAGLVDVGIKLPFDLIR